MSATAPDWVGKHLKVTTPEGGSIEFWMDARDWEIANENDGKDLRTLVAHEAWRALWKSPETAKMLKKLCDTVGVSYAKNKFTNQITWEIL